MFSVDTIDVTFGDHRMGVEVNWPGAVLVRLVALYPSPKDLEEMALRDDYFISRKLYPNVDFYSGIIYEAIGIPVNMFTVLFAMGRLPGWMAHWREMQKDPANKIGRPRQIYQGSVVRSYVGIDQR